jgi:hypothetical protein
LAPALASTAVAGAALAACDTASPITFSSSLATSAAIAGLPVHPGQAVSYAAFLASKPGGYSYRVTRARLIALPGFRTPHLLGTVFLRIRGVPIQARGYPPLRSDGTKYPVHSLANYTARSGFAPYKPDLVLMYGVRGRHLGGYAVAGLEITYRIDQHSYTADIYDGAVLFNYPRHETRAEHRRVMAAYQKMTDRAAAAMQKLLNS